MGPVRLKGKSWFGMAILLAAAVMFDLHAGAPNSVRFDLVDERVAWEYSDGKEDERGTL